MIRYVVTFPPSVPITPQIAARVKEQLREAVTRREYTDIVMADGAMLVDLAPDRRRTAALVRRARALHR